MRPSYGLESSSLARKRSDMAAELYAQGAESIGDKAKADISSCRGIHTTLAGVL